MQSPGETKRVSETKVMKKSENTDSTPTPESSVPVDVNPVREAGLLPVVVDVDTGAPVKYGREEPVMLRVSSTDEIGLDPFFFQGARRGVQLRNYRLKKIKLALKELKGEKTPEGGVFDADWFNDNVRDVWHRHLKFSNAYAMEHGTPVSVGATRRTNPKTKTKVTTVKYGYEFVERNPDAEKALEDKKSRKASQRRAKRQKRNRPLVSVGGAVNGTPQGAQAGTEAAGIGAAIKESGEALIRQLAAQNPK